MILKYKPPKSIFYFYLQVQKDINDCIPMLLGGNPDGGSGGN